LTLFWSGHLKLRSLAVILCSAVLVASPSYAEIKLDIRAGYEGQSPEGGWTQIIVDVSLSNDALTLKGRIEVKDSRKNRPSVFSSPVNLAPGTKKRICFYIPSQLATSRPIQLLSDSGDVLVSEILPSVTVLNPVRDPLILIVSGSAGGLVALRSTGSSGKHGPKLADLTINQLPNRSWAFDAIAMVVLRDLTVLPSPSQLVALKKYVELGGVLYFVGGGRPFWRAREYQNLLPDTLSENKVKADQKALAHFGLDKGRLPPLFRFLRRRSQTLYTPPDSTTPLHATCAYGSGSVVLSSFDPDAVGVRTLGCLPRLLKSLINLNHHQMGPTSAHRNSLGSFMKKQSETFFWEQPLHSPTILLLTIILITLYVVALAKGIPVLQKRLPSLPLLVIVPPLAIFFAVGLMLWAQFLKLETTVRGFSYELVAGPKVGGKIRGRRVIDLGFYAGEKTELSLTLEAHYTPSQRFMTGLEKLMNPFGGTCFEQGPGQNTRLSPIALNAAGFTWLRLETIRMRTVALEAIQLTQSSMGPAVQLRNTSPAAIKGLAVYMPGKRKSNSIFFIEELQADQVMLIKGGELLSMTKDQLKSQGDFWVLEERDKKRRLLVEALEAVKDVHPPELGGDNRKKDEIAWVAYIEKAPWPCTIQSKTQKLTQIQSGGQLVLLATEGQ
jgi:hypothetical protein